MYSNGQLAGLGESTNERWVNQYQNPFNQNYLFPITRAVDAGSKTPAQGYSELKQAWDRIVSDSVSFVNGFTGTLKSDAQATVNRWRTTDGPLVQSFLDSWYPYYAQTQQIPATGPAPAPIMAPSVDLSSPTQLIISGRTPAGSLPGAGFMPTGSGSAVMDLYPPETGLVAPQGDFLANMGPMVPWIAGGLLAAFLLRRRR